MCNPEAVPPIPNCDVHTERPSVTALTAALAGVSASGAAGCCEKGDGRSCCVGECHCGDTGEKSVKRSEELVGGGLAVLAAGPETMAREAKNAVARLAVSRAHRLGHVACHTEVYSL